MTDVRQPSAGATTTQWQVRPLGQKLGDIALDLLARPRPVAAVRLLSACLDTAGTPPTEDALLAWPVSHRLQGLLAVAIATRGEHWIMTARCTGPDCGAPMDLPISLDAFRRTADPATVPCDLPDGRRIEVSVPTGTDQLAWLATADTAPAAIVSRLVRLPDGIDSVPPDWLEPIDAALEQADPLTTLEIESTCPKCGAAVTIPLDLEARCLALLAAEPLRLLDEIHALATTYHWTEAEIMAIPPTRRRQYLARVDRMWS